MGAGRFNHRAPRTRCAARRMMLSLNGPASATATESNEVRTHDLKASGVLVITQAPAELLQVPLPHRVRFTVNYGRDLLDVSAPMRFVSSRQRQRTSPDAERRPRSWMRLDKKPRHLLRHRHQAIEAFNYTKR
jgi:hypothetical protein